MGDGDHISVLYGIYARPKSITVLDIDPRIVKSIRKIGKKYKVEINSFQYDVLKPLPKKFLKKFNFFSTNPPYGSKNAGQSGIAFISRFIEVCEFPSADSLFEICAGVILVQRTTWKNAVKGIENLRKRRLLKVERIANISLKKIKKVASADWVLQAESRISH